MQLAELAAASRDVGATAGRLDKINRLAGLLRRVSPAELAIVIPFLSGEARQGRMGIGRALLSAMHDVPPADGPMLEIGDVDAAFDRLAGASGPGSTGARGQILRDLFGRATRDEQDFLVRLLFGELRQGALEGVLVEAVARAGHAPPAAVRRAVMMAGELAPVARALLVEGESGLSRFLVQIFRPIRPMLAQPAAGLDEALADLREDQAALEWKLDGARIQVHKAGDAIKVFSRSLREDTSAVPEVVEAA